MPSLKPNTAGGPRNNDALCFTNEASEARRSALFRLGEGSLCFFWGVSPILKPKIPLGADSSPTNPLSKVLFRSPLPVPERRSLAWYTSNLIFAIDAQKILTTSTTDRHVPVGKVYHLQHRSRRRHSGFAKDRDQGPLTQMAFIGQCRHLAWCKAL
jgi:hypothetical protein